MKLRQILVAILALGLLSSCQSMLNMVTPKAPAEMVTLVKAKADQIRFAQPKKLGKSKQARMDLKAGQWVTTLTTDKGASGNLTLNTMKVISVSGSTVVIETESIAAMDNGVPKMVQITYANYPVKGSLSTSQAEFDATIKNIRLVKVLMKEGNNPVQEMPAEIFAMSQAMGKDMIGSTVRIGEMTGDACSTPYIESSLCYSFTYAVKVLGITRTGKSVSHSEIPVNGLVHMDSEDMVMETIAFGTSGATSSF